MIKGDSENVFYIPQYDAEDVHQVQLMSYCRWFQAQTECISVFVRQNIKVSLLTIDEI